MIMNVLSDSSPSNQSYIYSDVETVGLHHPSEDPNGLADFLNDLAIFIDAQVGYLGSMTVGGDQYMSIIVRVFIHNGISALASVNDKVFLIFLSFGFVAKKCIQFPSQILKYSQCAMEPKFVPYFDYSNFCSKK